MGDETDLKSYLDTLQEQRPRYGDFLAHLEHKARKMNVPLFGQFELTPLCTLDCKMCYIHLTPEQMDGPLLTVERWKDIFDQALAAGMLEATLTGGECLSYPGFDELYLHLLSRGCQVSVLTNGTLLDERRVAFFHEHRPALLQVTLYGDSEDTYERVTGRRMFQTVTENLRRVREAGLPLSISVTPSRTLGEDVFETIRVARKLCRRVAVNIELFVPRPGTGREGMQEEPDAAFYARVRRFGREQIGVEVQDMPESELPAPGGGCDSCAERGLLCGGGRSGFVVDWQGDLRLCSRLPAREPLRDGFGAAWQRINRIANDWPQRAECQGCAYEKVCNLCAARFLEAEAAGKPLSALCEQTKYLVSRGILPASECRLR